MKKYLLPIALLAALFSTEAQAQIPASGVPVTPLGHCQLSATQLAASIGLASCVRSSFTATGSGTNLTVTSVTGIILVGDVVVSGSGIPAGTKIVSQTSGTTGGAGVYVTSVATTISSGAATFGGIPVGATQAYLVGETANIRWRDDGGAPTAAVGSIIYFGPGGSLYYAGTLTSLRFILLSGVPLLNIAFYRG
jgi:hypothetical protein